MNARPWLATALACALLALAGCATPTRPATVAETAAGRPELSTLTRLMNEAGLVDTLKGPGPYTVFAPTDEAFKAVPAGTMAKLATDKALLKSVLSFHVVENALPAAAVKNGAVKTLQGGNVALSKAGDFVTVEDAVVMRADVIATNGVVHLVDRVLMPPSGGK
jgi:uncharacterized surface protein with fasciclin (FAS1) repeats